MRTLERSADLIGKLPEGSDAKSSVRTLIDEMTADMLRAYRNPSGSRWPFVGGLVIALVGVAIGFGVIALSWRSNFGIGTGPGIALMVLSVSLFTAGYALMFLAFTNRRRNRFRQRTLAEMEHYRSAVLERIRRDRWRPRRRTMHRQRLSMVNADIKAFKERSHR
jgi:hypothetical protein